MAYFSDTETSIGNTFTAGTIDISVDEPSTWQYQLNDMKPGYVDYSDFVIKNDGNNPVNVWKKVDNAVTEENDINEPECMAYEGSWDGTSCDYDSANAKNNLASVINYDLSVVVKFDGKEWSQMLYNEDKTIAQINAMGGNGTFLGMIPVGGIMEVTESYHMQEIAGNKHQSDQMTFDITLYGEQLTGEVVLEDKDTSNWMLDFASTEKATLAYNVTGNEFDYTLTGVSPITNGNIALVVGFNGSTNPDTLIGYGTTDGSGNITMNESSINLGDDLISAKVWLIPQDNWNGTQVVSWDMADYLWETGLIDYYDTNK